MGVDISCMIKNKFRARDNHEAYMKYINETIDLLNKHYPEKYCFDPEEYAATGMYQIVAIENETSFFMDL